ncbi:MAG: hypothetical protein ACE5IA_02285 [Dehalococcoidia bacterium]
MEVLTGIEVKIPEKEVLRLQGYKRGQSPRDAVARILREQIEEGYRLVEPRAVYMEARVKEVTEGGAIRLENESVLTVGQGARAWKGLGVLAISICTIGPALENRIVQLFAQSEFAPALMLDSVGSVAVESIADHVNHILCRQAKERKLKVGPRLSPGYGRWDLRDQRIIFDLLSGKGIGVHLNERCMMIPRKSISFCLGLGENMDVRERSDPCRYCTLEHCPYRRTTAQVVP